MLECLTVIQQIPLQVWCDVEDSTNILKKNKKESSQASHHLDDEVEDEIDLELHAICCEQ